MPATAEALRPITEIEAGELNTFLQKVYPGLEPISIDYGVMEKADNVYVVTGTFGWSDVGSWRTLEKMIKPDQHDNSFQGNTVAIESSNNIVIGNKRLVALLHVDDLVVVETEDALLICSKDKTQEVRKIIDHLKDKGKEEYL
jgi:mannose-1-phosphate guanylyltransferase